MQADTSIWNTTIENFRDTVAGIQPTPAGVSVSAVSASLALALLEKILHIISGKKNFAGDRERLHHLRTAAHGASLRLSEYAAQDITAFTQYMAARRLSQDTPQRQEERERAIHAALTQAIEVPLKIARDALMGLDLCAEAARFVHAFVAADLGAVAALLSAAVSATLLTVDFNLHQYPPSSQFYRDVLAERHELGNKASLIAGALLSDIAGTIQCHTD